MFETMPNSVEFGKNRKDVGMCGDRRGKVNSKRNGKGMHFTESIYKQYFVLYCVSSFFSFLMFGLCCHLTPHVENKAAYPFANGRQCTINKTK